MTTLLCASLIAVLSSGSLALAKKTQSVSEFKNSVELSGTLQRFLTNPEGEVDGFLLKDGTQVTFPPHLAHDLTAAVAVKDAVVLQGFRENDKVFHAEKVTNAQSHKSVIEAPPHPGEGLAAGSANPPPPPPPGGPEAPPPPGGPVGPGPGRAREGLQALKAEGQVQTVLYGRRGELNGAILSDNSIVRVPPRLLEGNEAKWAVGKRIKVSGFGSKTEDGQSIEATEIETSK